VYYEIHGQTNNAPTVLLSSGLGGAAHYWTPQIPVLSQHFRVITYDQRGTGHSGGSVPEEYTIHDMATEAASLLDKLAVNKCHFIGHALGGLIGLQLALDRPDLLDRLVVVNAWAKTHPHTLRCFRLRKSLLLDTGVAAYVHAQPLFLYPAAWLADRQDWLAAQDAAGITNFPPVDVVLRRIAAIEAFDLSADIGGITTKTLVVATKDDALVPNRCSVALGGKLTNAQLVQFDQGGHACNITDPANFARVVMDFLLSG
jgi:aminoacrylate hydrolase